MTPESSEVVTWVTRISTLGFGPTLALILFGGYAGVWVWGKQYEEMKRDRDEWKTMALRNLGLAEAATKQQIP